MVGNIVMDFTGQTSGITSEVKDMYSLTLLLYISESCILIVWCMVCTKALATVFFISEKGGGN